MENSKNVNKNNRLLNQITPQSVDFGKWYTDVCVNGKLIDYGPVRGTIIMRPNAYGIWENFQAIFNNEMKKLEVQNMYMPMFIPKSMMDKEADHILGFAPELATITHVGKKPLSEPLYTRPTSEVLFCKYFADHSSSYKDYPMMVNQWANVTRWEKTTNPFLRTTEFLWQEGHTVHDNALEARRLTRKILKLYEKILRDYFAIPVLIGKKTPREKFAGALSTYTCEAMMKDGKALQSATSHYLAQNFSKPFDISFKNKTNQTEFAYQTSWGMSTRVIGALIMTHGDDRGIIMPPKIAVKQVDILAFNPKLDINQDNFTRQLEKKLAKKFRINSDYSTATLGYKIGESEIQGTPIRIEIGPRDFANGEVTIVRRDTLEKIQVKFGDISNYVKKTLVDIHDNLLLQAQKRLKEKTLNVTNYDELKQAIFGNNFAVAPFCCYDNAEEKIQKEIGATARLIFLNLEKENSPCVICSALTPRLVLFARAY